MDSYGHSVMGIQLVTREDVRSLRSLVPDYASSWKQCLLSSPPALFPLPESSPFPPPLSSAAPGTPLSAYFTSMSLSNSRLFQQQNLMETNSVQGSIMGLFSYLWTEYFPLKDANDSLRDKLIKTPAKSRGKGCISFETLPQPALHKPASFPGPASISSTLPQMNTFKIS